MIDGVTILATETIGNKGILLFVIGVCGFITLMFFILAFIEIMKGNFGPVILLLLVSLLLGTTFGVLLDEYRDYDEIKHVEHVVTIDDSVGFKEFYNKYEILGVNGDLYTIKERE